MWPERLSRPAVWLFCLLSLLGLQTARQVSAARSDSPTWDEGLHLASGYDFLRSGDYRLDPEHPPLGRLLNALPLLWLNPDPKLESEAWRTADFSAQGRLFLNENRLPAGEILFPARLVSIGLSVALALLAALWMKARFGPGPALAAVLLMTVDPNLCAHGHLVTTDTVVALAGFAACLAFDRFLGRRRAIDLVLAGVLLGLALSVKMSALYLLPTFALLYGLDWRQRRQPLLTAARHGALLAVLAGCVVLAVYGPESVRCLRGWLDGTSTPLNKAVPRDTAVGYGLRLAGRYLHVPAHRYLLGLSDLAERNRRGHESYILGSVQAHGVWYYFPFAFLVKTPLGVLGLLGLCLPLLRRAPPGLAVLLVPLGVYGAMCLTSGINIGYRHLLVSLPFLYCLLAALWAARARLVYGKAAPALLALMLAAAALEPLLATRDRFGLHDLAFFNLAAGGPAAGVRLLVDSNLDWGQDLGHLRAWLAERGALDQACVVYFGAGDVYRAGIPAQSIPTSAQIAAGQQPACRYAAISATPLMGVYVPATEFAWLRQQTPIDRIGWSIYVYDVGGIGLHHR